MTHLARAGIVVACGGHVLHVAGPVLIGEGCHILTSWQELRKTRREALEARPRGTGFMISDMRVTSECVVDVSTMAKWVRVSSLERSESRLGGFNPQCSFATSERIFRF